MKTNLGRKFLKNVDKCFPKKHQLLKIFNRHTLKLSYSCMPNIKNTIATHDKRTLSNDASATTPTSPKQPEKECNCRRKNECPLNGKCLQSNVIYQATVTSSTSIDTYVGLAANFEERYRNHMTSLRHSRRRNETELSKHIWNLKHSLRTLT